MLIVEGGLKFQCPAVVPLPVHGGSEVEPLPKDFYAEPTIGPADDFCNTAGRGELAVQHKDNNVYHCRWGIRNAGTFQNRHTFLF